MKYNIYFELAAAALLVVLNLYVYLQYPSDSPSNRHFKRLAGVLFLAVTLDVVTAITISYADSVPIWLNTALNTIYLISDVFLECQFVIYCTCAIYGTARHRHIPEFTLGAAGAMVVLLAINIFTGWIFSFDETGYVHGPLYLLIHVIPIAAIIITSIMMIVNFRKFSRAQRISVSVYILVLISGPVVQLIFPNVLFTLFTVSIGLMMLMFAMETPDLKVLKRTMKELRDTRDEAEEAMAAAQSASQVKTEFLSTVSHEIRTPINAVLGFNEMVLRESRDEEITRYSENIRSAGKTLLAMISDMMDFTEMETGSFRIEETNYSAASMLSDIAAFAGYHANKKDIELRLDFSPDIPRTLHGDSVRITRILNDLTSNAVKYTERGWVEIQVGWEPDGDSGWLCVKVKDTGTGMRGEDVARISSSFLRMDKKRSQNIQGIGLGLTIVTRLLSMMDSFLEVESIYGKGTCMSFRLRQGVSDPSPVGDAAALTRPGELSRSKPGFTAPQARILIADDNEMNLDLYRRSLRETRVTIDAAVNGVEALELIGRNRYDLILLDHMMPVMDGMETLRTIQKQELCPGVPIIVVTANAVSGERNMYLNAGFDDYLAKPVSSRQLWDTVMKYLPAEYVRMGDGEPASGFAVAPKKGVMEQLGEFLDVSSALQYCCDSEELYLDIVGTYLEEDRYGLISEYFAAKDLENYRIQVHALKSGSRTIGANALYEEALRLEEAAKSGDTGYITENTRRVLEQYRMLAGRIRGILAGGSEAGSCNAEGRVLYIENDLMFRCLTERMLQEYGVASVSSGGQALEYLEGHVPELILLSAGADDVSLLKSLRSDGRLKDIPTVVYTADRSPAAEVMFLNAGAADVIRKPADGSVLSARIGRLLAAEKSCLA